MWFTAAIDEGGGEFMWFWCVLCATLWLATSLFYRRVPCATLRLAASLFYNCEPHQGELAICYWWSRHSRVMYISYLIFCLLSSISHSLKCLDLFLLMFVLVPMFIIFNLYALCICSKCFYFQLLIISSHVYSYFYYCRTKTLLLYFFIYGFVGFGCNCVSNQQTVEKT